MRLPILALLAAALLATPAAGGSTPAGPARTVYVVNASTAVSDAELANALPAFQAAVTEDFARYWGADARLELAAAAPAGAWKIRVEDDSDVAGALGYHDVAGRGAVPYARVFAAESARDGFPWPLVLTHELFEMLADPKVDRAAVDPGFAAGSPAVRLIEVGDPVEAPAYAYRRPGADGSPVAISDFVTEAWYQRGSAGRYDFALRLRRPLRLLPGGYVSWWDGQRWQQTFANGATRAPARRTLFSFRPPACPHCRS